MTISDAKRHLRVFRSGKTYTIALLIVSMLVLVLQMNKIRQLESVTRASAPGLRAGDAVPPLRGKALDGSDLVINYGSSKATVLYVFSPSCQWCNKNTETWSKVVRSLNHRYPVVGVSLSTKDLPAFLSKHSATFPVVTNVSGDLLRQYKLGDTPHTLVISREGRVLASWSGAYTPTLQKTLESYFGIKL